MTSFQIMPKIGLDLAVIDRKCISEQKAWLRMDVSQVLGAAVLLHI
jgi:hypothetical protein